MLLLGAILLAIFVLPSPWGIVAVVAGGLTDIAESLVLLKWSRRRRAVTGVEALLGKTAVVSSPPVASAETTSPNHGTSPPSPSCGSTSAARRRSFCAAMVAALSEPILPAAELWEARSDDALVVGEEVQVTGVDGLTLRVSRPSRVPR